MKNFIKNKKIIVCLVVLGIFIANSAVFALQVNWPSSPLGTSLTDESTLPELIKYLYEWGVALGGLAAFIALIIAGFQYLTSAGNPTLMADARGRMTYASLGLVLLLGSWLILNTISPELTTFRPLVLELPGEGEIFIRGMTCETDENCCEGAEDKEKCLSYLECKEGICVTKITSCEEVTITWAGGTQTIEAGKCEWVDPPIRSGKSFDSKSEPKECAGQLQLYGGDIKCEDMRAAAPVNADDYPVDTNITSIKLVVPIVPE